MIRKRHTAGRTAILLAATFIAALALTGCGSSAGPGSSNPNPSTSGPSTSSSGPGTYTASIGGVEISLTLPSPDDLEAGKIESLRAAIESSTKEKVEPFVLAKCLLANRSGETTSMGFVSFDVTLKDGTKLHSNPADNLVAGWRDRARRDEDQVLAQRADALMMELSQLVPVGAGGTATAYYAFAEFDLGEIKKIDAWYSKADMKPHIMVKKKEQPPEG
jgi:hypothetical protein